MFTLVMMTVVTRDQCHHGVTQMLGIHCPMFDSDTASQMLGVQCFIVTLPLICSMFHTDTSSQMLNASN